MSDTQWQEFDGEQWWDMDSEEYRGGMFLLKQKIRLLTTERDALLIDNASLRAELRRLKGLPINHDGTADNV